MAAVQVPLSPGVGARRRGPKSLPKLPISAFTPPNSGASERFPLPPSPSTLHPDKVVDGFVSIDKNGLQQWNIEAGQSLSGRMGGVVLKLSDTNNLSPAVLSLLNGKSPLPVLSAVVPLDFENGPPSSLPSIFETSTIPIAVYTTFQTPNPKQVQGVRWAFEKGLVIHVNVQCDLMNGEDGWESLEEFIGACVDAEKVTGKSAIVLSNILPPPHTLDIPLVKLLTHPTYRSYQARIASLSLLQSTYISYLPPEWNAATPATPPPPNAILSPVLTPETPTAITPVAQDSKEKREWKRRIKMYLGPVLEAYGFQRIVFGSCRSSPSKMQSKVGDWYELARESFAELGVDQDGIDAVFGGNARQLYGKQ